MTDKQQPPAVPERIWIPIEDGCLDAIWVNVEPRDSVPYARVHPVDDARVEEIRRQQTLRRRDLERFGKNYVVGTITLDDIDYLLSLLFSSEPVSLKDGEAEEHSGRVSERLSSIRRSAAATANLEHEGGKSQTSGHPLRPCQQVDTIPSRFRGGEALDDPAMQSEFSDGDGAWDIPRMADTIVELRAAVPTESSERAAVERCGLMLRAILGNVGVAVDSVQCPHCLFTFDAAHADEGSGGYSCPNCEGCPSVG